MTSTGHYFKQDPTKSVTGSVLISMVSQASPLWILGVATDADELVARAFLRCQTRFLTPRGVQVLRELTVSIMRGAESYIGG